MRKRGGRGGGWGKRHMAKRMEEAKGKGKQTMNGCPCGPPNRSRSPIIPIESFPLVFYS